MADELVSLRGLVNSDFDNPLRKFTGEFDSYTTAPASGYAGTRIDLNFKNLDNIVAVSPYNFPTAVINVGLSNKNKSKWGYLANSLAKMLPPDEDIKDCVGKTMTLVYCDGQEGRPAPVLIWSKEADPAEFPDKMMPTPVWIVESIEGVETPAAPSKVGKEAKSSGATAETAADWAEKNLIGKTRALFNKWAFADPKVRKDTVLQRSISDKSFVNSLVQLGRVVEDEDGVFQKVEEDSRPF
jgi:hypothetical protein